VNQYFSTQNAEETSNQNFMNLYISHVKCRHCTLRNSKSHFSTITRPAVLQFEGEYLANMTSRGFLSDSWGFLLNDHLSKAVSVSTGPIFTNFHRIVGMPIWSWITELTFFPDHSRTLPWQPILGSTKSAYLPSFMALAFRNRLEYRNSIFLHCV